MRFLQASLPSLSKMNPPDNLGKVPPTCSARGERRKRTVYSKAQVELLAKAFQAQPYPGYEAREHLARQTGIPEPRIHVWFQNRRARQLKTPHLQAGASREEIPPGCPFPRQERPRGHLPARPCLDKPNLLGRSWSHLGHPQPLGQDEEDPPFASQRSFLTTGHTSPFFQEWDSGIPLSSGNLSSLPQQEQHHSHGGDENPQWTLQNPPMGDHVSFLPRCSYNETTALHLQRGPDLLGPLYPMGDAVSEVQTSQSSNNLGLYSNGGSWENWG